MKPPSAVVFGLHEFLPPPTLRVPHLSSTIQVFTVRRPYGNTSAEMTGRGGIIVMFLENIKEHVMN